MPVVGQALGVCGSKQDGSQSLGMGREMTLLLTAVRMREIQGALERRVSF